MCGQGSLPPELWWRAFPASSSVWGPHMPLSYVLIPPASASCSLLSLSPPPLFWPHHMAWAISVLLSGIKRRLPWKGGVLPTGPPGKSLCLPLMDSGPPQIQNDLSSVLPLTTSARTPFPRKAHSEFGEDMNLGGGGCWLSGKESACSAGDRARFLGGEDPLEKGTAPVFWPGESQGQRSLAGYSPRGHNESDTTERL